MTTLDWRLCAGAATVDITPPAGTQLAGRVATQRPATTFLDPLEARAAVFQSDMRKFCLVALDVTIITAPHAAAIRQAASAATGIEPDAICLHATQTHNAPSLGGFQFDDDFPLPDDWNWVHFENKEYTQGAIPRIVEAIRQANDNLTPVEIGFGHAIDGRWAFNRRAVMRNGKIFMPFNAAPTSLGWTDLEYLEGPVDPAVGVLAARDAGQNLTTALLHYTCHPVHMFWRPENYVSADWCGALRDEFSALTGTSTPITINGCCGDVNPWNPLDPHTNEQLDSHLKMGKALASASKRVLDTIEGTRPETLDWRSTRVHLPYRELDAHELKAARELLADTPEPPFSENIPPAVREDWMQAAFRESVRLERERNGALSYEIQAFRLGDVALVALAGEPFAIGQLQIKTNSPSACTFVLHCCNHYAGYLAPRDSYPRGGHEVALSTWAKVAPGALEIVVEASSALVRDLFAS